MTHREFVQLVAARKAGIVRELLNAALPRGASFAVFTALSKSDDPEEEPLAVLIANVEHADVLTLVRRYAKGQQ